MSIISDFKTRKRISDLKKRARSLSSAIDSISDRYSCGLNLARNINQNLEMYERRYKDVIDELRLIDPKFPKGK